MNQKTHKMLTLNLNKCTKTKPTLLFKNCSYVCTTVVHNTAQNSSDNFPSYAPDNHHSSDDVYWMGGCSYGSSPRPSVFVLPVHAPTIYSHSVNSPLSPSITPSLFHSRLETYLFHKSFPPQTPFQPQDWLHGLYDRTVSSEHFRFFLFLVSSLPLSAWFRAAEIKLATRQLLGAR